MPLQQPAKIKKLATVDDVSRLIKFIVRNFDDGFAILLGAAVPPSSVQIGEKMNRGGTSALSSAERLGSRVEGGEKLPFAQILLENEYEATVQALGGWEFLTRSMRAYREAYPETWGLFEMYALYIRRGGAVHNGNGGGYGLIAKKVDEYADLRTHRRRINKIIQILALYIITRPDAPHL